MDDERTLENRHLHLTGSFAADRRFTPAHPPLAARLTAKTQAEHLSPRGRGKGEGESRMANLEW